MNTLSKTTCISMLIGFIGLLATCPLAYAQEPTRPLIFLPGILGSKLYKENELVWGDRASYRKFRQLQLPFNGEDDIEARGIIEDVRVLGPFRVKQYSDLIKYLTTELEYMEDETLFIFAYDWRKSNFKSAEKLQEFIAATPQLRNGSFDILAHSMGGLVARILIDKHESGSRVSRYVTLGTPFLGSLDIVDAFVNGFDGLQKLMAGGNEVVRSVMFSFESGYEMIPVYPNCCYKGTNWESRQALDLLDPSVWEDFWFPASFNTEAGRRHVAAGLQRRRELDRIVKKQLDWEQTYHAAVATSIIATLGKVRFQADGTVGEWRNEFQGDGRVTLISATKNAPYHSRVSLSKHGRIFDDDAARDNIKRVFITNNDLFQFSGTIRSCEISVESDCVRIGDYEISGAVLSANPGISIVGEPVNLTLTLIVDKVGTKFPFEPKVCVHPDSELPDFDSCEAMASRPSTVGRFSYSFVYVPQQEGTYAVSINDDSGLGFTPDDYFMTFGK